jgi:hypothetical protein
MSRTTRKRRETWEQYTAFAGNNEYWVRGVGFVDINSQLVNEKQCIARAKARYYSRTEKWFAFGLPKDYRQMINKQRRARSVQELWKELHWDDYEEQCDLWNGKTNNPWGYW